MSGHVFLADMRLQLPKFQNSEFLAVVAHSGHPKEDRVQVLYHVLSDFRFSSTFLFIPFVPQGRVGVTLEVEGEERERERESSVHESTLAERPAAL